MTRGVFPQLFLAIILALLLICFPESEPQSQEDFSFVLAPPVPPDPEILKDVLNLGSTDVPTRDAAGKKLRAGGWSAMADLLLVPPESTNDQARAALNAIIEDLCWDPEGLSKETAAKIEQARKAWASDPSAMREFEFFFQDNSEDVTYVFTRVLCLASVQELHGIRFSSREEIPISNLRRFGNLRRRSAWDQLEWEMICFGSFTDLTQLLYERPDDCPRVLRMLQAFQQRHKIPANFDLSIIVEMVRNRPEALRIASLNHMFDYQAILLAEKKDWPALAAFKPGQDFFNVSRFVPAGALLFSGKIAEADDIIDSRSKALNGVEPVGLQRQLVLLGRIELINKALVQRGDSDTLVEFLLRERRYSEAMGHHSNPAAIRTGKDAWSGGSIIAGGQLALGSGDDIAAQLDGRLLLALLKLNEIDRARAELERLSSAKSAAGFVMEAKRQLGIESSAESKAAPVATRFPADMMYMNIAQSFGKDYLQAMPWCELIWVQTKDAELTQKKVQLLLNDQMPADEIMHYVELSNFPSPDIRNPWYWYHFQLLPGAAIRVDRLGRSDLAEKCLQYFRNLLATPGGSRRAEPRQLAAILADVQSLGSPKLVRSFVNLFAAESVEEPVFQYLSGTLMEDSGDLAGRQRRLDADQLIGGDVERRTILFKALRNFGNIALAREQAELVCKIDTPTSTVHFDAREMLAQLDEKDGLFPEALQNYRLAFFANFYSHISIPEDYDRFYSFARHAVYCESRVALSQNDPAAALESAKSVPTFDCEDLPLTLQLIAAFKAAKFNDQAQALAAHNRSLLEAILKDFPNSHLHHYLIAKLDFDSGFTTDQTLPHLRKALELAPKNPNYLALNARTPHP